MSSATITPFDEVLHLAEVLSTDAISFRDGPSSFAGTRDCAQIIPALRITASESA
jgi:hypothetical protein